MNAAQALRIARLRESKAQEDAYYDEIVKAREGFNAPLFS